jgi:hypothetical protein
LDDAPDGAADYSISLNDNSITSPGAVTIPIARLTDGETYPACSGTLQVPQDTSSGGLTKGVEYYARVVAVNSEGYSVPQTAALPFAPTVVPGAPSGVTLEVVSATELKVVFSAPNDNGGDAITQYKIEYATLADFSNKKEELQTNLAAGAPFHKTIRGLTTGTFYYVRVSAMNRNGYGGVQATTPSSLNPRQPPDAPSGVTLSVTSNSMLTVGFGAPASNGGDTVSNYVIEWDTAIGFNSGSLTPDKGSIRVDAATQSSYTIELLSTNRNYFARVAAINSAGVGAYTLASPASAQPTLQSPGTPHTVVAVSGSSAGEIVVTWQRPKVPRSGVPCFGTTISPQDCPTPYGGSSPASDGGDAITEYEIEFNERADFGGSDGNRVLSTGNTKTLTSLTSGRVYYIRVLARNTIGSGLFCERSGSDICDGNMITAVAT